MVKKLKCGNAIIYIVRIFLFSVIFLYCLFVSGCYTAYYYTQTDPQIMFNKHEPLTIIYTQEIPSITEKKFAILLSQIMSENGFIVNNIKTKTEKCYINFSIDTYSSQHIGSYTTYYTNFVYIPGVYNGNGYNPGRIIRTITPNTNVYTTTSVKRDIGVSIICKDNKGIKTQVWFGFVSADIGVYNKYQNKIIENLVGFIGKDFDGYLNIKQ